MQRFPVGQYLREHTQVVFVFVCVCVCVCVQADRPVYYLSLQALCTCSNQCSAQSIRSLHSTGYKKTSTIRYQFTFPAFLWHWHTTKVIETGVNVYRPVWGTARRSLKYRSDKASERERKKGREKKKKKRSQRLWFPKDRVTSVVSLLYTPTVGKAEICSWSYRCVRTL